MTSVRLIDSYGEKLADISRRNPGVIFIGFRPALGQKKRRHQIGRDGRVFDFGFIKFRIVVSIIANFGAVKEHYEVVDHVWGNDPSGGPEDWGRYLYVVMNQSAPRVAALGLRIQNRRGIGYEAVDLLAERAAA